MIALVRKRTLTGRRMRAGIIRKNRPAMARTCATVFFTLAVAACLAACGQTLTVGADRAFHLALTEYWLRPQRVQARTGTLTIFVRNDGRLTHNLAVSQNGHAAGSTPPISPGRTSELVLRLRRGTYRMASTMLSDQTLGLYGTLVVK